MELIFPYPGRKHAPNFDAIFQEVGSIIGKKGEIVKRFREEVS